MTEGLLVSAVITTHNRKELLVCAVKSVLAQTYNNMECIVVDDASDDGTEEYLKSHIKKDQIKYIYIPKEESKGGNQARNRGIICAKGEYIAFLDDDDEWLDTKVEKQVNALSGKTNVGIAYCGMIYERDLDSSTREEQEIESSNYEDEDLSKSILLRIITANTSTLMVKRDLLLQAGGFDEQLNYWQEYELCIRLMQTAGVVLVREDLVLYRILKKDKNRLSNHLEGWGEAVTYIVDKHKNLIEALSEEENGIRKLYIYIDGFTRAKSVKSIKYMLIFAYRTAKEKYVRKAFFQKLKAGLRFDSCMLVGRGT